MTSNMHWLYQILATALHAINLFGGVVPAKYQPFVAFALVLIQGGLGLYNHYFTPDGNRIARTFPCILLLLLLCSSASAQTQHFSLSGSAVSFMGPNGAAPASIADGYTNVTKSWSIGYQQVTIPQLATFKFGIVDLTKPLPSLLGKKNTAKLVFDASLWTVDFYGGAGKVNQDNLGVDRVAETLGICASRKLTTNVSAKLVCGQWLHGGTINGILSSGVTTGASSSTAAVSSGITLHF